VAGRFLNENSLAIAEVATDVARKLETTPTAVSLAWLLSKPVVSSVIIGPRRSSSRSRTWPRPRSGSPTSR